MYARGTNFSLRDSFSKVDADLISFLNFGVDVLDFGHLEDSVVIGLEIARMLNDTSYEKDIEDGGIGQFTPIAGNSFRVI